MSKAKTKKSLVLSQITAYRLRREGVTLYFSEHQAALDAAGDPTVEVDDLPLFVDQDGNHYLLTNLNTAQVFVDVPSREAVLAKLTPAERFVLGFESPQSG